MSSTRVCCLEPEMPAHYRERELGPVAPQGGNPRTYQRHGLVLTTWSETVTKGGCDAAVTTGEAIVTAAERSFADHGCPPIEHSAAPGNRTVLRALHRVGANRSDLRNTAAGCPAMAIHIEE